MTRKHHFNLLPYVYLVFGVYFFTFGFGYIDVPEYIFKIHDFIIAFGGILFFVAAYNAVFHSKRRLARKFARM